MPKLADLRVQGLGKTSLSGFRFKVNVDGQRPLNHSSKVAAPTLTSPLSPPKKLKKVDVERGGLRCLGR